MKMLIRFYNDVRKYWSYAMYAAKSELKGEIANSHLGWLWWFLDPLLFMMVYTFIAVIIFRKGEPYFPIYVFIGLQSWNFFSKTVRGSVKIVRYNKGIISKVYLPKVILVLIRILVNGFKMCVSFSIVVIMMVIYQVPVDWHLLFLIPLFFALLLLTFGVSIVLMHFGVYVEDLANVVAVLLQLCFYMTGIFYSIEKRVPVPYNRILLRGNPVAYLVYEIRNSMLYEVTPNMIIYVIWLVASVLLCIYGINLVYKSENNYVKAI